MAKDFRVVKECIFYLINLKDEKLTIKNVKQQLDEYKKIDFIKNHFKKPEALQLFTDSLIIYDKKLPRTIVQKD